MQEQEYPILHLLENQLFLNLCSDMVDKVKNLPKSSTIFLLAPLLEEEKVNIKKIY